MNLCGLRRYSLAMMTTMTRLPGVAPRDDAELLALVAGGDRHALAVLSERYGRPLFAYLSTLLADRSGAEETLQDTLLAVWRGAGTFQGRSAVSTWLFGIARRQAHTRLRRYRPELVDDQRLAEVADDADGPETLALARRRAEVLQAAVGRLRPLHREVLVLTFWQGLSQAELSQVLDVPVGTVKSRLSNARSALRRLLEQEDL